METCTHCLKFKETPRSAEEVKGLVSRINRITGQLGGIKKMLEENRYCGDILVQVAAAESALRAFGYLVFEEHMNTCVVEKIKAGDPDIVAETVELAKRLN